MGCWEGKAGKGFIIIKIKNFQPSIDVCVGIRLLFIYQGLRGETSGLINKGRNFPYFGNSAENGSNKGRNFPY